MKKTTNFYQGNQWTDGNRFSKAIFSLFFIGLFFAGCRKNDVPPFPGQVEKIKHVVVIYLENHSFDNLYGQFAGANGLSNASASNTTQVDISGNPYAFLPPV